jgi:hypothetical protein
MTIPSQVLIGSSRRASRNRLAQQPTPTRCDSAACQLGSSEALGEPRIFTAIDGMRAPFYSHMLHKIVSLWDNSNQHLLLGSRSSVTTDAHRQFGLIYSVLSALAYTFVFDHHGQPRPGDVSTPTLFSIRYPCSTTQGVARRTPSTSIESHRRVSLFLFILGLFFSFAKQVLVFFPRYSCRPLQFSLLAHNGPVRLFTTAITTVTHFERPSLTWLWNSESVPVGPSKT